MGERSQPCPDSPSPASEQFNGRVATLALVRRVVKRAAESLAKSKTRGLTESLAKSSTDCFLVEKYIGAGPICSRYGCASPVCSSRLFLFLRTCASETIATRYCRGDKQPADPDFPARFSNSINLLVLMNIRRRHHEEIGSTKRPHMCCVAGV